MIRFIKPFSKLVPAFGAVILLSGKMGAQEKTYWRLSSEPIVEIGVRDGRVEELFQEIVGIQLLPGNRIVVADNGFLELRVFDGDGSMTARMGGEGGGPGEFRTISGMWTNTSGQIGVWDSENRFVTIFDAEGGLIQALRATGDSGLGNLEVFFGTIGEEIVLASLHLAKARASPIPDPWVLSRFRFDGRFSAMAGHVRGMWRTNRQPVPFSAMPMVAVLGDSLVISDDFTSSLSIRDKSGQEGRQLTLDMGEEPSVSGALADLETRLRELEHNRQAPLKIGLLERGIMPEPETFPRVAGILTDSSGMIWVKEYLPPADALWLKPSPLRPGPGGKWRVFTREGSFIAVVEIPPDVIPFEVSETELLGLSIDALGVQRIVKYGLAKG